MRKVVHVELKRSKACISAVSLMVNLKTFLRAKLLVIVALFILGATVQAQVTYTYTSNGTHTVSEGVKYVIIEAVGGGGAGGSVTNGKRPAGGGGGGAYSRVEVDVSVLGESKQISYTVGAGGTAGTNDGDGGNTTVSFGGYTLTANGGNGAASVSNDNAGRGASGGATSTEITGTGTGISNYHSYAGGNGATGGEESNWWNTTYYSGGRL